LKRKAIDKLILWKEEANRKPILITGVKGVGKTYLAYDFAKAFFEHICYMNFERDSFLNDLLNSDDIEKTKEQLLCYYHLNNHQIEESVIFIFDEISYSQRSVNTDVIHRLADSFPYIICISSSPLPNKLISKMQQLPLYPLEFDEFLRAIGSEWYIDLIKTHYKSNTKLPEIVHNELLDLHYQYMQIGGMPGAVNEYLSLTSLINVSEQHSFLIGSYHDHMNRDHTESVALKMKQVFDSILFQLMKENKKFQYKLIRKGTTHAMYKEAIEKLSDADYVLKCCRIQKKETKNTKNDIEFIDAMNDHNNSHFKLYLPDIGLLFTGIKNEYGTLSKKNKYLWKALLENYVAQAIQAKHYPFVFWESDSSAKVDFIIYNKDEIIPIEVFETDNTRSKNLNILQQKFSFTRAVKISSKNFEMSKQIKYIPYYAVFCLD